MKNSFLLLVTVLFISTGTAQTKIGGATLPGSETFKEHTLVLNGAGVRQKFWINLYAAGLYLSERSSDANAILASQKPMALKLHVVSRLITSDKMVEAVTDGFESSTNGNTAPIQREIDTMIGFFQEDIEENDVFDLVYVPSQGVTAYKNGKERGTVHGEEFKRALFGIWLSNRPADDDLRDQLLGK